ncbi:MAG: hypothetical protein JWQ57_3513, partial [Mucilaginibacter sp.]|nr:hypothetical protein [Mucilaginibacter sp.]
SRSKNEISDQKLKVNYVRRKRFFSVNASTDFHTTDNNSASSSQINLYGTSGDLKSSNNLNNTAKSTGKDMSVNIDINREKNFAKMNKWPGNWSIDYGLNLGNTYTNGTDVTFFKSISNPSENQRLNRVYDKNNNDAGQHLTLGLGDLSGLLFGYRGLLGVGLSLRNNIDLTTHKEDNLVRNADTAGIYRVNPYLTNASKLTVFSEQPALVLTKTFSRELANRYKKAVFIDFALQEQFYNQKNSSVHVFQNFERNYRKFVPSASISYNNDQYGDWTDDFTLSFSTIANYPTVNQLRPLVDSSNLYYIVLGNPNLKEAKEHKLSFKIEHTSQRMKNTFGYNAEIAAGIISNALVDSSITDDIGRSKHYTVNASGSRYITISGALNKAFKFKEHQLQLQFSPSLGFYHNPIYINSFLNISNTISSNNRLSLFYTISDWWAANLIESFLLYSSRQKGANDVEFRNSTVSTILGTTINFTKRMSLGSNASYNSAASTGSRVSRYTIWNANAVYRMLKGNNLELKLAALDLLHQNTGIINTGFNNTITRGTSNVLKQYFMISLAYYPRQFGSKEKQKTSKNEN